MPALSAAQALLADEAIVRVEGAARSAKLALDSESVVLTWVTGSGSARAAREESYRQTAKILDSLKAQRPSLQPADLGRFLNLASAGANVDALIESARRMTGAGFHREVIAPTVKDLNPFDPGSFAGKVVTVGLAVGVVWAIVLLKRK